MGVFKNEVGRPSNKIIRIRRLIIAGIIISFVLAIILIANYGILSSMKKLKGEASATYNVKGDNCSFHIINIKPTSAQAYWNCSSGGLSSFTVYHSDPNGSADTKAYGTKYPSEYKQASMWNIDSGLKADNWYLISYKTKNNKIFNINFKTPKSGTTNPVSVNKTRVTISEIEETSVKVAYNGISTYAKEIHIYEKNKDGSRGREVRKSKFKSQYGNKYFAGLGSGRKYIVDVKFDNDKTVTKEFKTKNTSNEYNVKGDYCSFRIINIKPTKAEAYWNCTKGGLSSFTVYDSNPSGTIGKKVFGTISPKKYKQASMWNVDSGLMKDHWYLISYKTQDNGIYNIKFKTPQSETENPVTVTHKKLNVYWWESTYVCLEYNAISYYVTKIEIYYKRNLFNDYNVRSGQRQYDNRCIYGLNKNTEYTVRIKFDDGTHLDKKFKTKN